MPYRRPRPPGQTENRAEEVVPTEKDTAAVVTTILLILLLVIAVTVVLIGVFLYRRKTRGNPFLHVRMQDATNMEISNPMYLRGEYEDDVPENLDNTFGIDPDKATNFTNPMFDSVFHDGAISASNEEKKGLLQSTVPRVEFYDTGAREREPLRTESERDSFA